MEIRPATKSDLRQFYGRDIPWTVRAYVADLDGEIIGIGGYYMVGNAAYAFTDQHGMTKRQMVEAGRAFMEILHSLRHDVFAQCGKDGTMALRHFGFIDNGFSWSLPK